MRDMTRGRSASSACSEERCKGDNSSLGSLHSERRLVGHRLPGRTFGEWGMQAGTLCFDGTSSSHLYPIARAAVHAKVGPQSQACTIREISGSIAMVH